MSQEKQSHCPCPEINCKLHGNCQECVATHVHYKEHVPYCMREIINQHLRALSGITEHSILNEIKPKEK